MTEAAVRALQSANVATQQRIFSDMSDLYILKSVLHKLGRREGGASTQESLINVTALYIVAGSWRTTARTAEA